MRLRRTDCGTTPSWYSPQVCEIRVLYLPPTKLQKGNVSTSVHLFTEGIGIYPVPTYPYLPTPYQPTPPTYLPRHLSPPRNSPKWAVHILPECTLVSWYFVSVWTVDSFLCKNIKNQNLVKPIDMFLSEVVFVQLKPVWRRINELAVLSYKTNLNLF